MHLFPTWATLRARRVRARGARPAASRHAPAAAWLAPLGALAAALLLAGCTLGPDYHRPTVELPATFKEGVDWQRSAANPQASIDSQWWLAFGDPQLTQLIAQALSHNQSIVAAEAAHREALAVVDADRANLFPTVTAGLSGTRSKSNGTTTSTGTASAGIHNAVNANLTADWEPDLWGGVRRQIESGQANAQASDATLAGERLSITATLASDYFALRGYDADLDLLQQQQQVDTQLLALTQLSYQQGTASNDSLLLAQDTLQAVIYSLHAAQILREQEEHAIAVLTGVPPAALAIGAQAHYSYPAFNVPLALPSTLLERRPDVIVAERTAAAANAQIGVAKAAFFPTLDLSAQGGFQHNTLANLFTMPNRVWTLGPSLAATVFDAGAHSAVLHEAQATYDEDVANYRGTVLTAFQNVEDSLSSINHLNQEADAYRQIYQHNTQLFGSEKAQLAAGTASQQSLLTQQLTLLSAQQNLADAQSQVAQSTVLLIKNLGGGWQAPQAANTR